MAGKEVFSEGIPYGSAALAIEFSPGESASLPVIFPGLLLYALLRCAPAAEAGDHRAAGAQEDERVWVGVVKPVAGC